MRTPAVDRNEWPAQLPGATRFTDEGPNFMSPLTLVSQVKGLPRTMDLLDQALIDHGHGQRRSPGHWPLLYLCFTVSREPNIEPWYRTVCTQRSLWSACGFTDVPAYQTVWQRFTELERFAPVFEQAAAGLIQLARRKDPRIGAWIASDGTECETHAQPIHDCDAGDACPTRGKKHGPKLKRLSAADASAGRQKDEVIDPADAPAAPRVASGTPIPAEGTREETEDGVRFVSGGHWWRTRDRGAGTRLYKGNKVWFGHMHHKAVDLVTRAPLAVMITSATENEHHVFPHLYERATANSGVEAVAVLADAGLSVSSVSDFLVERGVTPVMPSRRRKQPVPVADGQAPSAHACDKHGIPVCRGCGLPCDFVRFVRTPKARVWFRCPLPSTDRCEGTQSMLCSKATRRLIPIWRTSPVYNVLRNQLGTLEHVHEDWRTWFRSGGKNLRERPRRVGIEWQQLRASAALLIEWIWVLQRQGWIGRKRTERVQAVPLSDGGRYSKLMRRRRRDFLLGGGYASGKAPPGFQAA